MVLLILVLLNIHTIILLFVLCTVSEIEIKKKTVFKRLLFWKLIEEGNAVHRNLFP